MTIKDVSELLNRYVPQFADANRNDNGKKSLGKIGNRLRIRPCAREGGTIKFGFYSGIDFPADNKMKILGPWLKGEIQKCFDDCDGFVQVEYGKDLATREEATAVTVLIKETNDPQAYQRLEGSLRKLQQFLYKFADKRNKGQIDSDVKRYNMENQDELKEYCKRFQDENKRIIQDLYKKIMSSEERQKRVRVTRAFCEEVKCFIDESNPTPEAKDAFYKKIVYAHGSRNPVAEPGPFQSQWGKVDWLTSDELDGAFSEMLSMARAASGINSAQYEALREKFFNAIKDKKGTEKGSEQSTIFNRIIAAVFPRLVLPIPSEKNDGFVLLYNWMVDKGFLKRIQKKPSWFDMNGAVVVALNEAFKDYPEKVDEFQKWAFAGELWERIKKGENPMDVIRGEETLADANKLELSPEGKVIKGLLEANLNVILTGAPGTGKTYAAKRIAFAMTGDTEATSEEESHIVAIQFHPGYDYSDFVIGMKPVLVSGEGKEVFRQDGKLYLKDDNAPSGERQEFKGPTSVSYDWKDGVFKKFAAKARKAYDAVNGKEPPKFVFIIDEINRADLSRVFGELFSLLEEEYRYFIDDDGNPQNEKGITLPNGEPFVIPKNLYIIGTMNDIDRSVESMDFALRRRFAWYEVTADKSEGILDAKDKSGVRKVTVTDSGLLKQAMRELNKVIGGEKLKVADENGKQHDCELRLGIEYQLGGAIFAKLEKYVKRDSERKPQDADKGDFEKLWSNHIENILLEYLRGRTNRKELVKGLEQVFYDAIKGEPKPTVSAPQGGASTGANGASSDPLQNS